MLKKNNKILVTGAGGFIGSHLSEKLIELGYNVKTFVHYNSSSRWGWLDSSQYISDIEVIMGDIRDFDSVFSAMKNCNTVFHLAALIGIPYSYSSPLAYIRTNIEGTYNVLQAAHVTGLENILITSTSEVYGTAQYLPIAESHPVIAQSPYAATKIAADQLALSFYRSFDLPVKIVRPFNVYGPRQSARAIVPTIILQIISGLKVLRMGSTQPTRDFSFVEDTCDAFIEIYKCKSLLGTITNIGTNREISIAHLVDFIAEQIGTSVTVTQEPARVRPSKSEVERLLCDNSRILQETSWRPNYPLEEGIAKTIDWFKQNLNKYKPYIYNL